MRYAPFLCILMTAAAAAGQPVKPEGKARLTRPVMCATVEADKILAHLEVFPPDNPWNQDVSRWPLHPNSRRIIATIGVNKPLRHNRDMAFVLVPRNQPPVPVKVALYPGESDHGPFPVPDNLPIEGWPVNYQGMGAR